MVVVLLSYYDHLKSPKTSSSSLFKTQDESQGSTGCQADALAFDRKLPFILHHVFDILHDYHDDDDEEEEDKKLLLKLHHMFDTLYDYHEYVTITGKPTLSKYQHCSVFDTQAVQHRYQHNPSTTESSIRSDTKI